MEHEEDGKRASRTKPKLSWRRSFISARAGRTTWWDWISVAFSSIEPAPPVDEKTPGEEARTAFERLDLWCKENDVELIDFRDLDEWPRDAIYKPSSIYGWPQNKERGDAYGNRKWKKNTCLMLHWTGTGPMAPERGLGIPVHMFVTIYKGRRAIVLLHNFTRLVAHGHAGNKYCAGLEICGDGKHRPSKEMCELGLRASQFWVESRREAMGDDINCYVCGHINTHWTRGLDPNEEIIRGVYEPLVDDFGCLEGPVVKSGKPIKDSWWSPGRKKRTG